MPNSQQILMVTERLAAEHPSNLKLSGWLHDAVEDFGVSQVAVQRLLDRSKWKVDRPKIIICPRINQIGNFQVMWRPEIGPDEARTHDDYEFDIDLVRRVVNITETYAGQRPPGELQWFRNIPRRLPTVSRPVEREAALLITKGIKARYNEMIRLIRSSLHVTMAGSMSFDVDKDGRIEWAFEATP